MDADKLARLEADFMNVIQSLESDGQTGQAMVCKQIFIELREAWAQNELQRKTLLVTQAELNRCLNERRP